MKFKIILLCLASTVNALVTFSSGQIAKAEDFNANFTELSNKITTIEDNTYSTAPNAKVNGVDMYVYSISLGSYLIKTPTGIDVYVDENGLPSNRLYFESNDCSGQAYISVNIDTKEVGLTYINPKITPRLQMAYKSSSTLYTDYKEIVTLNYNSYSQDDCSIYSGSTMASETKQNNLDITGISFPATITNIGSPITIVNEVGSKQEDPYLRGKIVYANGTRIGIVNYLSLSADFYISVILDDYPEQSVTMYKDGTYTGLNFGTQKNIYYLTTDCTGNGYVKVLNDNDKEWWISSYLNDMDIVNNDKYYKLSTTIYKMINGTKSYKNSYTGSCYASTETTKEAYKLATEISTPNFPIYTPPITIESVVEDINYNDLLEAN